MKDKYNSMNMSNEFQKAKLNDPINMNVAMRTVEMSNEIAERFTLKERKVKEVDSFGNYRIPTDVLKKRTNPSDEYEAELAMRNSNEFVSYENRKFQNESIDNIQSIQKMQGSYQLKRYDMIDVGNIDENASANENLIKMLEAQVRQLKQESQELKGSANLPYKSDYQFGFTDYVDEPKVATKIMAANDDRVQAVKHVYTQQKPEYMSLEEFRKLREEHEKKLLEVENTYYGRKNPADIQQDLENERRHQKQLKRAASARRIQREGYNRDAPIDKKDERYLKKYANYLAKKSNDTKLPYEEEWNNTKIKSQNSNGVIDRKDGLTGCLDRDDYLLYYCTISNKDKKQNDFERPLLVNPKRGKDNSVSRTMRNEYQGDKSFDATRALYNSYNLFTAKGKGGSRSRSPNLNRSNMSFDQTANVNAFSSSISNNKMNTSYEYNKPPTFSKTDRQNQLATGSIDSAKNSQLSFIKMIFGMMDKDNNGSVSKTRISEDMKLDENMIKELGFYNEADFQKKLEDYPTSSEQVMNEKEFTHFLVNQGQVSNHLNTSNHLYYESQQHNQKIPSYNNTEQNFAKSMTQIPYQDIVNTEDQLPGLKTNTFDFLKNESTKKRLKVLNESLRESGTMKRSKSQNGNEFGETGFQSQNIQYEDYSNFVQQYPSKLDINFTVPEPFDFLKKNYNERKLLKIQEILEERQRNEEAVFNKQFHPNSLNPKMFEGNLNNIIENEKRERKKRTEKLKDEIVNNMKPFSFYAQDEMKYKEKISRECQAPQFPKFKANPIEWKSQVNMYEGLINNDKHKRETLAKERAIHTLNNAHLPPRMEMHEKEKKLQEQTKKLIEEQENRQKKINFMAKVVPNFTALQERFISTLEKQKKAAKPTVPQPFTFHEPKKKAELCTFLDNENNPNIRNPQRKQDIQEIIQKLQKKPDIEPATTKGLTLLMETRRKELEAKKKQQEKIMEEDKRRKENHLRYKDRVQIEVFNRMEEIQTGGVQMNDENKTFKERKHEHALNQQKAKQNHKDKLKQAHKEEFRKKHENQRIIQQKVNNRPLLFQSTKENKIVMGQNIYSDLSKIIAEETQKAKNEETQKQAQLA